jgi:hypothetical protein
MASGAEAARSRSGRSLCALGVALALSLAGLNARVVSAGPVEPERIDVLQLESAGLATLSGTPSDIGTFRDVFDGDPSTLYRSAGINPASIEVTFEAAVTFEEFRGLFSHHTADPAYLWRVDAADTMADLDNRTGTYQELVPWTDADADVVSVATLTRPAAAKVVRLTVDRLGGDDFVHIDEWEIRGTMPFDLLADPRGIVVDSRGRTFVAESRRDRIVVYDATGSRSGAFGTSGSGIGQLDEPWDLTVDPCGGVNVVDRANDRLQVFDPDGLIRRAIGGSGAAPGSFERPEGVAVERRSVVGRTVSRSADPGHGAST